MREIINTVSDITEENLFEIINNNEKLNKYLNNQIIKKKIYVKNRLINIII